MASKVKIVLSHSEASKRHEKDILSRGQHFLDALFHDTAYARYLIRHEGYGSVEANWRDPMFGNSSLHNMVFSNSTIQVSLLLECGADPNIRNKNNETPLHWACRMSSLKAATILLDNGADINATDASGSTPLHCAAAYGIPEVSEMYYILLYCLQEEYAC